MHQGLALRFHNTLIHRSVNAGRPGARDFGVSSPSASLCENESPSSADSKSEAAVEEPVDIKLVVEVLVLYITELLNL